LRATLSSRFSLASTYSKTPAHPPLPSTAPPQLPALLAEQQFAVAVQHRRGRHALLQWNLRLVRNVQILVEFPMFTRTTTKFLFSVSKNFWAVERGVKH
jgi:hypothetical protein